MANKSIANKTKAVAAVAAMLISVVVGDAFAQSFPQRPVHIIVGFPAGGGSDVPARIVAPKLGEVLGQPVIVENRTGANGYVGAQYVAKSAPDGYIIYGCSIATHGTGPALYKTPPVDAQKDFSLVGMIGSNPNVLMVHPSVPAKTMAEFVAWAKAGGSKYSYAIASVGGSPHLSMELLKQMAGFDLLGVPYRGDAPARQDVIAGHVPVMFGGLAPQLTAIKGGLTRAIAVTSSKRDPALPDVPTIDESGFPGFSVISWLGLCAPAGTPEPVLETLSAALVKVLNQSETREQLLRAGVLPDPMPRAEFTKFVDAEITKWRKVAQTAGIFLELEK